MPAPGPALAAHAAPTPTPRPAAPVVSLEVKEYPGPAVPGISKAVDQAPDIISRFSDSEARI